MTKHIDPVELSDAGRRHLKALMSRLRRDRPLTFIPVEIRPIACPVDGGHVAALVFGTEGGGPPRVVYGEEHFTDRAECEAHAIRVAHGAALAFSRSRDWDGHEFTVTVKGTQPRGGCC